MAKAETARLDLDYFLIRCQCPGGDVGLGLVGSIRLNETDRAVVMAIRQGTTVPGLDAFGAEMVSVLPDALERDIHQLINEKPDATQFLTELARRYRGTIFASEPSTSKISLNLAAEQPGDLMAQIIKGAMRIAVKNLPDLTEHEIPGDRPALQSASHRIRSHSSAPHYQVPRIDSRFRVLHEVSA